jgi:PPP family 3-phenylpropionic acid transporter
MAFYALRLGLYSIMPSPYWVLGISALNGPTYVFFWNSAISYAFQLSPAEYKATAQGLFVATTNLSAMVGALLSGWLYDTAGPSGMFRILTLFCLAAFVLFAFNRSPRISTV